MERRAGCLGISLLAWWFAYNCVVVHHVTQRRVGESNALLLTRVVGSGILFGADLWAGSARAGPPSRELPPT